MVPWVKRLWQICSPYTKPWAASTANKSVTGTLCVLGRTFNAGEAPVDASKGIVHFLDAIH